MNSVSEIMEEVNALEVQRMELEENIILQVCNIMLPMRLYSTYYTIPSETYMFPPQAEISSA